MRAVLLIFVAVFGLSAAELTVRGRIVAKERPVALAGARVTVSGPRLLKTAATDADGRYEFDALPVGTKLHFTAGAPGFVTAEQDVGPELETPAVTLDWTLTLANRQESVVVESGVLSLRSDAPEQSQTITESQMRDLPSNGRRLMRFALLDPHVRQSIGLGADGNDSYRLSINGNSYRHTAYMIDGTINYDWYLAVAPQQPVSVGAVEELKVLSGQYAAEFGTSTAGVLTVTTKSGTDQFHGEAIGFVRPSGLQSQAPLAAASLPHIPNEREQWGASLGGPLIAGRTVFFANYEGSHQERGAFIQSPAPSFFPGTIREHYGLVRIDHRFNDRNWLSWRANGHFFSGDNVNDFVSGFNQPSTGRVARLQSHGSQVTLHSLAGLVLNEVRVSYASYFPNTAFPLQSSVGISHPNYSVEGNSSNSWAHVRNLSAGDVVAIQTGIHQWKFGASYLRQQVKDYAYAPFGTYTFAAGAPTPGQTPLQFSQTLGVANLRYGQTVESIFAQDDMRIARRITSTSGCDTRTRA